MAPVLPSARWRWVVFGYDEHCGNDNGYWNRLFESISPGGFPTEDIAQECLSVFAPLYAIGGDFTRYEIRRMIVFHPLAMRGRCHGVSSLVVVPSRRPRALVGAQLDQQNTF